MNLSQILSSWSSRLTKYKAFVRLYFDCGDTNYDEAYNGSLLQKLKVVKSNVYWRTMADVIENNWKALPGFSATIWDC